MKWLACFLPFFLFATAPSGLFTKFPNAYFVETGSHLGTGITQAFEAGFSEIHSIELAERYYYFCKEKFASNPSIHLWFGDSSILLEKVIATIDQPITFWLDGHWSGGDTGKGKANTPILHELEAIQKHPVKNHTILIDDVRCFGTDVFERIQLSEIVQKIYEINSDYQITYECGHQENDILVAQIMNPS